MRIEVETTIREVTVFPSGAQVTRRGVATVEAPGEHDLRVTGLPLGLQADSLRANGQGPAGTQILGVELERQFHRSAPEETLRHLQEIIREHEERVAQLGAQLALIEQQAQWLRILGEQSARSVAWGVARGSARPEDMAALLTYTREEAQRLSDSRGQILRDQQEAQRALDASRRELSQQGGGATWPDRQAALVRIIAPLPGEVTVNLAYLLGGASWSPRYDARVDIVAGQVHLLQQGIVAQRTGEDWPNVALALSTARPNAAMHLPDEPEPWYLDDADSEARWEVSRAASAWPSAESLEQPIAGEAPFDAKNSTYPPIMMASPTAGLGAPRRVKSLTQASAPVESAGAARIFRLSGGNDVPTDGQPHTVGIGGYDLPCRFEYVAEPTVAPGAHLRAIARNSTGQALLPGALHIFHATPAGDEYAGQTRLELTAENAELPLYLGIDDNVTVKRELTERETERGNLLQSGITRVTLAYTITLANHTGKQQRVIVKDALPLSRHARIKVRTLDIQPQPSTRTGMEQLTWELQLASEEKRHIRWRVQIEAPTALSLSGLP